MHGHIAGQFFVDGGHFAVGGGHHGGLAAVGLLTNLQRQGQRAQKVQPFVLRQGLAAIVAKNVLHVAALAAHVHGHVLHQAQNWHADFFKHLNAFAGIGQGNVLRRGDDDGTGHRDALAHGQLDVARAGGQVDDEVIQPVPVGLAQHLLQRLHGHGAAPDHGLVGVF